ncbi:MAG TPA: glycoside hydrolase family 2 TIM barrel-domain containing protein [Anaerolineales bacterium]|jgi:endo-1,4-beta-mannosidase
MEEKFMLGVNYWPRHKAMYWWSNFDPAEVDDEFAIIRDLGLNVVRIFLLWDDFQPEPDRVDRDALANLVKVADIASKHGLGLDVTFFTGHMSGPNWAPRWLLTERAGYSSPYFAWIQQVISQGRSVPNGNYLNMFSDPLALRAERLLLKSVVGALKDHPAIWMWNLGNEPDLFAWPANAAAGRAWVHEMTALIKSIDPIHPVTLGTHSESLSRNNGLRLDQVHAETDVPVMHSYPMYCEWARGPLDPDFVPFTTALSAALAGKPALMEEFGGCTNLPGRPSETWEWVAYGTPRTQFMASEQEFAEYIQQVLPSLQEVGAKGAFVWCFADYVPELWSLPPCSESRHERHFGLLRPDGSLKPHAEVIRQFAATSALVKPIPPFARFPALSGDEYYAADLDELQPALYRQYLERKTA